MLEIENLKTNFNTYDGVVKALDGVNLKIEDGEIFGLVGETGSGKSVTCYSALKLLPKSGEIVDGKITLNGEDITHASEERLREIRGGEIGIIFQDPLSALNPVMTVNEQIGEIFVLHQNAELQKLASEKEIKEIQSEVKQIVEESVKFAEESPDLEPHELYEDVYVQKDYPFIKEYL